MAPERVEPGPGDLDAGAAHGVTGAKAHDEVPSPTDTVVKRTAWPTCSRSGSVSVSRVTTRRPSAGRVTTPNPNGTGPS